MITRRGQTCTWSATLSEHVLHKLHPPSPWNRVVQCTCSSLAKEPAAKKCYVDYGTFLSGVRISIKIARQYRGLTVRPKPCQKRRKDRRREKSSEQEELSERWIAGAKSVRTSNIRIHACSSQHVHAMLLLKKEYAAVNGLSAASYAPFGQMLQGPGEDGKAKPRKKFDIVFFCYYRKASIHKYPSICLLEAQHGVDLAHILPQQNCWNNTLVTL